MVELCLKVNLLFMAFLFWHPQYSKCPSILNWWTFFLKQYALGPLGPSPKGPNKFFFTKKISLDRNKKNFLLPKDAMIIYVFVHGEIFAVDYNLRPLWMWRMLSVVVCRPKFNSVFLSQMKSDWADFWICYSSNKTWHEMKSSR